MLDIIQLGGLVAIVAGVFILFGLGFALLAAGVIAVGVVEVRG